MLMVDRVVRRRNVVPAPPLVTDVPGQGEKRYTFMFLSICRPAEWLLGTTGF